MKNAAEFPLDPATRELLAGWLTPTQLADGDVADFVHRLRRAHAEEKQSSPDDWTVEQRAAHDLGHWVTFSRLRGYTTEEIFNFGEFMRLANELDLRYGKDVAISIDFEVTQFDQAGLGPALERAEDAAQQAEQEQAMASAPTNQDDHPMETQGTTETAMVPHLLKLVDPGPSATTGRAVGPVGSFLGTDRDGWASVREEGEAMVFPSWVLAQRFARRFMVNTGQSWLPVPTPEREATIPGSGVACRSCGCTDNFACPGRCAWHEPGLCSECAKGEELVMWVVYDRPTDYPDSAIARKFIGGVPTQEFLSADTVEALRESMPERAVPIPRSPGDPKAVVEVWL